MQTVRSQRRESNAINLREKTRSSSPSRRYQSKGTFLRLRVRAPMTWALAELVTNTDGPISVSSLDTCRANERKQVANRNICVAFGRRAVSPAVAREFGHGSIQTFAPANSALSLSGPSPGTIRWNSYDPRRCATSSSRLNSAPPIPDIAHSTATLGNGIFDPQSRLGSAMPVE